ncbi:hypothetical protein ABTX81_21415 [Kitasatospora sp. NPDC097605]|uniref:hypothetical protein n=1 Tax=Kitasatospora sp. NPDC097605 TaxID=3157226 RepID=UPI003325C8A2
MTTPARAPWIPGGGTALDWGLRNPCPVGVGPGGYRGEGGKVWCLDCGDRYTGCPAQVGDEHAHRDDAQFAARLHADEHEAEFRRFVVALRTEEAREKSGWTSRVYALVAAATREDPDGGVWWDGSGYRLVPAGGRLGAKGRRVRRKVVELVIKAGFLRQDEHGEVWATADGRAMLKIWQPHRAELAEPWPARHEPQALPPLPGGQEDRRRQEAARQLWAQLQRQQAETRAELVRLREQAEQRHQDELAAERQRRADAWAERERAERARTGADIDVSWSAEGAGRWTVTGSGHDRRLVVTLNTTDFAHDSYEIRENGYFISRHRYRHHAEAAVQQLLADGVEIGPPTPGPTPPCSWTSGNDVPNLTIRQKRKPLTRRAIRTEYGGQLRSATERNRLDTGGSDGTTVRCEGRKVGGSRVSHRMGRPGHQGLRHPRLEAGRGHNGGVLG